ncbi:MAG: M4 family metallopeptidase [Caldilineaceae bacterium]
MQRCIQYALKVLTGKFLVLPLLLMSLCVLPAHAQDDGKNDAVTQRADAAIEQLRADTGVAVSVSKHPVTGVASYVRLPVQSNIATLQRQGVTPTAQASSFFQQYGAAFGIKDAAAELRLLETKSDSLGGQHLVYQQVYQGVDVFAGQVLAHFNTNTRLTSVNGLFVPEITLNIAPRLSAAEAANVAVQLVLADKKLRDASTDIAAVNNHLYIYRAGLIQRVAGANHLAYQVEVANADRSVREFVFVDAQTGKVIDQFSGVHHIDRHIFNGGLGEEFLVWSEGDPQPFVGVDEVGINNLIDYAEDTYNLYATMSNGTYISWDGADGSMLSVLNDPIIDCPNANWNGTSTNYCNDVSGDDTVAHEWSHAYTERNHNLIYAWQPGALNESYSDIFGEVVDILNGAGLDSPDVLRTAAACSLYQTALPAALVVNAPAEIAGVYNAGGAAFGPPLADGSITGDVVLADDGVGVGIPPDAATTDACEPLVNAADINGKIALVDRGSCNFTVKVKNAQDAGAIGVIVANHELGGDTVFNMAGEDATITIPSVMIGFTDGNLIKAQLFAGVNATLGLDPSLASPDDSLRWLSGEDDPAFGGAIRDMWNPTCFGDPGKVSDLDQYVCTEDDGGGVHSNSGVPNHAFALLVDGGDYNGQSITGIGLTKASHIYWRAEQLYQGPATGFPEHADALEASCQDLVDASAILPGLSTEAPIPFPSGETMTAADCAELSKVIAAVELRTEPTQCDFQPMFDPNAPALCLNEGTVQTISLTDWEAGLGAWTPGQRDLVDPTTHDSPDWLVTADLPDGRSGQAAFVANPDLGDCAADLEAGVRYLESPLITIPAGANVTHIALDHWMSSELGWDGGNVKMSINGGPWRLVPAFAFNFNPYNSFLQPNPPSTDPLGGEAAFTGGDGGMVTGSWGQSQINLGSLVQPGDTLQLRLEFGQDGCSGVIGWYVDDVQVYSCAGGTTPLPPGPEPLACNTTVSFTQGVPSDWMVLDNSGGGVVWTDIFSSGETDNYTGGANNAASVSSDAAGPVEFDTELHSTPFDLTEYSLVSLSYLANYQNLDNQDFLDLDISIDGGLTWETLLSWNEDHGGFRVSGGGELVDVDLSAYAGLSGLILRWHYYDPNNRDYDWYAQVDDVTLSCVALPAINVEPGAISETVQAGNVVNTSLTISNSGTAELNWSLYEGQQPAANRAAAIPKSNLRAGALQRVKPPTVKQSTGASPGGAAVNGAGNAVADGGFEAGSPNPFWEEGSVNFGTVLCNVAVCGPGAANGEWWAWLGGVAGAYEAGGVTQTVTIPAGASVLSFYLMQPACDSSADYLAAQIDGEALFVIDGTSPNCGIFSYALQEVDISAYADGGAHTLAFVSETFSANGLDSSFFVDDVAIGFPSACTTPADVPWLTATPMTGTVAPGGSAAVSIALDATGLANGAYQASLCIESDDAATPLVEVPVSLNVTGGSVVVPEPDSTAVYLSSSSSGKVGNVEFRDEDVLVYNPLSGEWAIYFDGSNLSSAIATNDIDALEVLANGDLLLSFERPLHIGDLAVDDSDIVLFEGDSYGENNTAGAFSLYFDGSAYGLTR